MIHAMHALGVQYLANPVSLIKECHSILLRVLTKNVDWLKLFGDSLMEHFAKHIAQACFRSSCTVDTDGAMKLSFSMLLHQMACFHPCMVW
jgi:hypothetical protein